MITNSWSNRARFHEHRDHLTERLDRQVPEEYVSCDGIKPNHLIIYIRTYFQAKQIMLVNNNYTMKKIFLQATTDIQDTS